MEKLLKISTIPAKRPKEGRLERRIAERRRAAGVTRRRVNDAERESANRVDRNSEFRNAIERETSRGWRTEDEPLVLIHQIRSIKPQIATDWRKLQPTKTTNTKYAGGFAMLPEAADSDGVSDIRPTRQQPAYATRASERARARTSGHTAVERASTWQKTEGENERDTDT